MTRRDEIERELGKCVGPPSSAVQIAYRCTLAIIEAIDAKGHSDAVNARALGDSPARYGAIDDERRLWYTRDWGTVWIGCRHGTPSSGGNPTRICVACFDAANATLRRLVEHGDKPKETEL